MKAPVDKADLLLTIAAGWLAARGESPKAIADRARGAAELVEKVRSRVEGACLDQIRTVVGCTGRAECACVWCEAQKGIPTC